MCELKFRRIELSDKNRARELLEKSGFRGCEYTFGNNFVWRDVYKVEVCFFEDFYFVKQLDGDDTRFLYPAGTGSAERAVGLISEYCRENGLKPRILANKDKAEEITAIFTDFSAEAMRDYYDYIYLAEDLANLKGKKYHAKRNHLNRFYENSWSFEPITADNLAECAELNARWCEENLDVDDKGKLEEQLVVQQSFEHYEELGYYGGLIRVDGVCEAFSFGERSAENTFVVHVEKASRKFQGAYAAINRELVNSLGGKYLYINREDDAGSDNLRKAKLSYYPAFLEEKFYVTRR